MAVVRVIHDARDAKKDTFMTVEEAKLLLRQGTLFWDITNECYCTPTLGKVSYASNRQVKH